MRAGRAVMALALLLRGEASAKTTLPDPKAARATLGEEDFARYSAELNGLIGLNPLGEEYARRAQAPDDAAASKADDQIAALQQQMLSNATASRKQMDLVLTKEQRQQLRRDGY